MSKIIPWKHRKELTLQEIQELETTAKNDLIFRLKTRQVAYLLEQWSYGKRVEKLVIRGMYEKPDGTKQPDIIWHYWDKPYTPDININNVHEWRLDINNL